jgi:hypothetical protein
MKVYYNNIMKSLILTLLIFCSTSAIAAELKIEPVYGVERTQRQYPEPPKYVTRTVLGMRALYGVPLISAELEVNQSTFTDSFPDSNEEVTYTNQRAMLGIRSYPIRSKVVGIFFRAGARAKQQTRDIKSGGSTTTEKDEIQYDPYAGTGITLVLTNLFALNAGATLAYNKDADPDDQYDVQYTFSFTIKAKSK